MPLYLHYRSLCELPVRKVKCKQRGVVSQNSSLSIRNGIGLYSEDLSCPLDLLCAVCDDAKITMAKPCENARNLSIVMLSTNVAEAITSTGILSYKLSAFCKQQCQSTCYESEKARTIEHDDKKF